MTIARKARDTRVIRTFYRNGYRDYEIYPNLHEAVQAGWFAVAHETDSPVGYHDVSGEVPPEQVHKIWEAIETAEQERDRLRRQKQAEDPRPLVTFDVSIGGFNVRAVTRDPDLLTAELAAFPSVAVKRG